MLWGMVMAHDGHVISGGFRYNDNRRRTFWCKITTEQIPITRITRRLKIADIHNQPQAGQPAMHGTVSINTNYTSNNFSAGDKIVPYAT